MRYVAVLIAALVATPCFGKEVKYDCVLEAPKDVRDFEPETKISTINVFNTGSGKWAFALTVDSRTATIVWPNSPMQLSGRGGLIPTSDVSAAFFLVSQGPCLFTHGHCGSLVHYAEQSDKTLKILLQPIADIRLQEPERKIPYKVFIDGSCKPAEERK